MADINTEPTIELYESSPSIWQCSPIVNIICGHLRFTDLKSFRLVNKTFLEMSTHKFVQRSMIKAKESLAEFNASYDNSNLKNVTAVQFEKKIKIPDFEAFLGIWKNVTDVRLHSTKFLSVKGNVLKRYEPNPALTKHIKSIKSWDGWMILRTSSFPAIENLDLRIFEEPAPKRVILDGPISPISLSMEMSVFMKKRTILSPNEWQRHPELDFSILKSVYVDTDTNPQKFTFSVERLLQLETFVVAGESFIGGRVLGWHNNLKVRKVTLTGLDVNLVELPPSIKKCEFYSCSFKPCTPTNLTVEAIRYSYSILEDHEIAAGSSGDFMQSVNLAECKDLRIIISNSLQLNTSFLPSSLQHLRMLFDCNITGEKFAIDTLSLYRKIYLYDWKKDHIDNILKHFNFKVLHIEYISIYTESELALFKYLMDEVNRQGKTLYMHCWLRYQGLRDCHFECKNGAAMEVSQEYYKEKIKNYPDETSW